MRYRCSAHELRDLFRSEWELSGAKGVVAEFMMGHTIDSNNYNKIMKLHPEWAEEQFRIAMPFLNILSEDPRKVSSLNIKALNRRLEAAQQEIGRLKTGRNDEISDLRGKLEELEDTFDLVTKESMTVLAVVAKRLGDEALLDMLREAKELTNKKWWRKQ